MRREERVTVQGPVKEQQPDGMSHRGGGGLVRALFPDPPPSTRAVGRFLRCTTICGSNPPRPAVYFEFCLTEKNVLPGRVAAQVVSHHSCVDRLFGLACHESPLSNRPSFGGIERPPTRNCYLPPTPAACNGGVWFMVRPPPPSRLRACPRYSGRCDCIKLDLFFSFNSSPTWVQPYKTRLWGYYVACGALELFLFAQLCLQMPI